jgi:hypothetical protein
MERGFLIWGIKGGLSNVRVGRTATLTFYEEVGAEAQNSRILSGIANEAFYTGDLL